MSLGALSNSLTELNFESENVSGCPGGQICSTKANCKVYKINRYGHRDISQRKASQGFYKCILSYHNYKLVFKVRISYPLNNMLMVAILKKIALGDHESSLKKLCLPVVPCKMFLCQFVKSQYFKFSSLINIWIPKFHEIFLVSNLSMKNKKNAL